MRQEKNPAPIYSMLLGGVMLSFVGGFLEANTFILRGGVFANAQTGNIAFMAISFFEKNPMKAFSYLMPISAFVTGIIISKSIPNKMYKSSWKWEHGLLMFETIVLLLLSFVPFNLNYIVTISVSFICALQYNTFSETENIKYSSVFCTNNLRQASIHFHDYIVKKDKSSRENSLKYIVLILGFCLGAGTQTAAAKILEKYSLMIPSLILLSILITDRIRAVKK